MSNAIVNRMAKLLYKSCPEEKQTTKPTAKPTPKSTGGVITCTKLRRLQQMQSEVITCGSLTEDWDIENTLIERNTVIDLNNLGSSTNALNPNHIKPTVSLQDLIAARIAETEQVDGTIKADTKEPSAKNHHTRTNDHNRTLLNLDSLAASIYFWSPNASLTKEEQKFKFTRGRLRGQMPTPNTDLENNSAKRNKDTFINFSQAALIMVAKNPETPTSTLKWLAAHHCAEVRKAVAQNENIDDETMIILAEDPDDSIKNSVLDNARISKDLAAKLASNKSLCVSTKARNIYYQLDMQPKEPLPLSKKPDNKQRIMQTEREFLKALVNSADTSRKLIVKSPRLMSDGHIRMLVAGNPNATTEILWQLATHPISQVKRKLVDKYNCLLETIVNLKGHKAHDANDISMAASDTETIN